MDRLEVTKYCKNHKQRYLKAFARDYHQYYAAAMPYRFGGAAILIVGVICGIETKTPVLCLSHFTTALLFFSYSLFAKHFKLIQERPWIFWEIICSVFIIETAWIVSVYSALRHEDFLNHNYLGMNIFFTVAFAFHPWLKNLFIRQTICIFLNSLIFIIFNIEALLKNSIETIAYLSMALALSVFAAILMRYKFYVSGLANDAKVHAYEEISKILYKHQVNMIEDGVKLQSTMPSGESKCCIISFDIQNSSKIGHKENHLFFENVMKRCHKLMMTGYRFEGTDVFASAFRIKEMGDGFLCSVGFPFKVSGASMFDEAHSLAMSFVQVFNSEVERYFTSKNGNIYCGIGIVYDTVIGGFPATGAQEYDLFGNGIVLATRYESFRKTLLPLLGAEGNIIIVSEEFFSNLSASHKTDYNSFSLTSEKVRDAPSASSVYYWAEALAAKSKAG
jgi:class 3 adenylate cyclase